MNTTVSTYDDDLFLFISPLQRCDVGWCITLMQYSLEFTEVCEAEITVSTSTLFNAEAFQEAAEVEGISVTNISQHDWLVKLKAWMLLYCETLIEDAGRVKR